MPLHVSQLACASEDFFSERYDFDSSSKQDGITPQGVTPQNGITLQKVSRLACALVLTAPRLRVSQNAAASLVDVLEMFFC